MQEHAAERKTAQWLRKSKIAVGERQRALRISYPELVSGSQLKIENEK